MFRHGLAVLRKRHTAQREHIVAVVAFEHGRVIRFQQDLVGQEQHEIRGADERRGGFDGVDEALLLALDRVADADAAVRRAEVIDHLLGEVADHDDDLFGRDAHGVVE